MRPKSFILLVLALGCGVVASIGITQVMAKRGADPAPVELESVVVAIADIPMGDPVSPQLVKLEDWPKDKVPKGALRSLEELENRRPKTRIFAGSPILDSQLLGKGVLDQGASDVIPKGMRVIAVKVDSVSGNANLIRPGDRVDVLVHLPSGGGDLTKTITKTILQDIKVFAVDNVWATATGTGERSIVAKTISLLVTPAQAEKVTLASEMGNIRLVMRSPDDKEHANVSGAVAMDVVGGNTTGGIDRMVSALLPANPAATAKSNPMTGLLGLLNRAGKSKAQDVGPPAPSESEKAKPPADVYRVRILSDSEATETVLEYTGEGKPPQSETSFLHWRASTRPAAEAIRSPLAPPPASRPAEPSPAERVSAPSQDPAPAAEDAKSADRTKSLLSE